MIQHFPILAIMVLFLGAFLTVLCGKNKVLRNIVVFAAMLASSVFIAFLIKPIMIDGEVITYWLGNWSPVADYAIGICLVVDQLNLFFAILVSVAVLLAGVFSFKYMSRDDTLEKYFTLFLMLSGGVMGLVLSGDLFNMFIMVEILTFAAVALTAFRNRSEGALEAAFKYLVIGVIGSSCILIGTTILYSQFHTLNLAQLSVLLHNNLQPATILAFTLLLTGFAVKAFVVPFHPVEADANAAAPSSVSVIISCVLTKAGIYGIIRIVYFLFRSMNLAPLQFILVLIGTLSMFIGVTMALAQKDFKRLLAFHSISQVGYVMTAIGLATALGVTGGLYHAINHTLFKGLLFLCAGAVFYATGTTNLDKLGGLAKRMPQTAALFLIGAFSISGLPPFNGFVSKWLIYQATYEKAVEFGNIGYAFVTIIALVVSVMTLASFIKVSQSVFFGQLPDEFKEVRETPVPMRIPMWIMAALCVGAGLLPQYMMRYLINPAVYAVMNVGNYIGSVMGPGYAEKIAGQTVEAYSSEFALAGYWSPISWLALFAIIICAFFIVSLSGGKLSKKIHSDSPSGLDPKYDTFFSGEANEHSQVGGSDLFWGFKHNLRHYFDFMHNAHSGVISDYALWAFCFLSFMIVYLFIIV